MQSPAKWIGGALTVLIVGAVVAGIVLFMKSHDLMNRVAMCEGITGPDMQRIFESPPLVCKDPGIGSVQYTNRVDPQTITIETGLSTAKATGDAHVTYEASRAAAQQAASKAEGSSDANEHFETVAGIGDEAFWTYTKAGGKLVRGRLEWRHGMTTGMVTFWFAAPTDAADGLYQAHCIDVANKLIKLDQPAK